MKKNKNENKFIINKLTKKVKGKERKREIKKEKKKENVEDAGNNQLILHQKKIQIFVRVHLFLTLFSIDLSMQKHIHHFVKMHGVGFEPTHLSITAP